MPVHPWPIVSPPDAVAPAGTHSARSSEHTDPGRGRDRDRRGRGRGRGRDRRGRGRGEARAGYVDR
ncbi:MAG TPA: hypothetical protein ENK18_15005 [Deltaproteobacteria bacterium]|nr:hypothetical protein [Deltaproteobacteria bacterium]